MLCKVNDYIVIIVILHAPLWEMELHFRKSVPSGIWRDSVSS